MRDELLIDCACRVQYVESGNRVQYSVECSRVLVYQEQHRTSLLCKLCCMCTVRNGSISSSANALYWARWKLKPIVCLSKAELVLTGVNPRPVYGRNPW